MKITFKMTRLLTVLIIGMMLLSLPSSVQAQDTTPPPELEEEEGISDADILVFEPTFHLEFPFAQGFQITLNFGIKIEVPRRLLLVENDVLNFFLRFSSYVIPAE